MAEQSKLLITGAHGFVGARAMEQYRHAVAVPGALVRNAGEALAELVHRERPEVILNAAAISDIGTCEGDPEGSYAANVILPVVLAEAARDVGAKLISFSSDQVYTGCQAPGPYREDADLGTPTNLYARHKLEAEERVLRILPSAVQLRATWMYDMPLFGHANRGNFLTMVLKSLLRREKLFLCDSDRRGITYVRQVVALLDKVFTLPGGVYNYGSENSLSMYETAKVLAEALGMQAAGEALLVPRALSPDAPRPHALWMDCEKLRRHGVCFDTTAEGLRRVVADYFHAL